MAKNAKVTLEYNVSDGRYYVATIQGTRPTVEYTTPGVMAAKTARVGAWLDEQEAGDLGLVADLMVRRYTV